MKVFVFDLDFTIWNAGDTFCSETNPPYLWKDGKLVDCSGRWIRLYPDTIEILEFIQSMGIHIAIASRTEVPANALELIAIFNLDKYFIIKEIYPGSKTAHLKRIQEQIDCPFDQIVFFDDEDRNIVDAKSLGVRSILVKNGIKFIQIQEFFN